MVSSRGALDHISVKGVISGQVFRVAVILELLVVFGSLLVLGVHHTGEGQAVAGGTGN